jgi:hypothetical protein
VAREKERGREMQRKKKTEQKRQDGKIIKYSQAKNIRSFFFCLESDRESQRRCIKKLKGLVSEAPLAQWMPQRTNSDVT